MLGAWDFEPLASQLAAVLGVGVVEDLKELEDEDLRLLGLKAVQHRCLYF
jgi:hypothetical protein